MPSQFLKMPCGCVVLSTPLTRRTYPNGESCPDDCKIWITVYRCDGENDVCFDLRPFSEKKEAEAEPVDEEWVVLLVQRLRGYCFQADQYRRMRESLKLMLAEGATDA